MKILVYGLNFHPELTGIGKYTGDMVAWFAARGHDVRVITAPPYYPAWVIESGYKGGRWTRHMWNGVNVWRCPLWVPRQPGGLMRLLHLFSFSVSSLPVLLGHIFWRADVVWVVEPALFCAPAACAVARLSGASAWLHIQDFEVDAAFELGLLKGTFIRSVVRRMERWLMRRFDRVSTISTRMLANLLIKGVDADKVVMARNWVDVSSIVPRQRSSIANPFRAELGIAEDAVIVLYSGNMGSKQGLNILADVARMHAAQLASVPLAEQMSPLAGLVFLFCGDGSERGNLQYLCNDLSSVIFIPLQPVKRLNDLLALADIHLLPQRADASDLVMPSKLTGILASGRPVVATAHMGTELDVVVSDAGCAPRGLVVPPEDASAMLNAVYTLVLNVELRLTMGASARKYAEQYLHIDNVLADLEQKMQILCS